MRLLPLFSIVTLVMVAVPSSALGAYVELEADVIRIKAGSHATLHATAYVAPDAQGGRRLHVRSASGPVEVGPGCELDADLSGGASCPIASRLNFYGTAGDDHVALTGELYTLGVDYYVTGRSELGAGNDTFDVDLATHYKFDVTLGDGDDVLRGCANCEVAAGPGSDTLTWSASDGPAQQFGKHVGFENVTGSSAYDRIYLAAQRIDAGDGDDVVYVNEAARTRERIDLGPGDDRLHLLMDSVDRIVVGGPGLDTVMIPTDTTRVVVCLDERVAVCGRFDGIVGSSRTRLGGDLENIRVQGSGPALLAGNSADNLLQGGKGDDALVGGSGADRLVGDRGFDYVTYEFTATQQLPVVIRLDGKRNDGTRGEDLIHESVEGAVGSQWGDRLSSSAWLPTYLGGAGGNDVITGGPRADYLDGGPGNDVIRARAGGADQVRCGPGRDTVIADSRDRIAKDCEIVRR